MHHHPDPDPRRRHATRLTAFETAANLAYDHSYTASRLLRHRLDRIRGDMDHERFLLEWIAGRRPPGVPPHIAALLDRNARPAAILGDFHRDLLTQSKQTPYPAAQLSQSAPRIDERTRPARPSPNAET